MMNQHIYYQPPALQRKNQQPSLPLRRFLLFWIGSTTGAGTFCIFNFSSLLNILIARTGPHPGYAIGVMLLLLLAIAVLPQICAAILQTFLIKRCYPGQKIGSQWIWASVAGGVVAILVTVCIIIIMILQNHASIETLILPLGIAYAWVGFLTGYLQAKVFPILHPYRLRWSLINALAWAPGWPVTVALILTLLPRQLSPWALPIGEIFYSWLFQGLISGIGMVLLLRRARQHALSSTSGP